MKPSSPLSLLLFLSLTTAAPISLKLPKGCLHYTTCQPWLRELFSSSSKNDHTPPTRLPSPHFPLHQLYPPSSSAESHRQMEEDAINNAPLTPPKDLPPTIVLAADRPLQSSYLLSLSNPALTNPPQGEPQSTTSEEALPSKPTSALPELREEDAIRYWATITSDSPAIEKKVEVVISHRPSRKCNGYAKGTESAYLRVGQPMIMAREYSDLLVVGIVVLFLAAVIVMEAMEYFGDVRSAIFGNRRRTPRHGKIFLNDDEKAAYVVQAPFSLQDAPRPKPKASLTTIREVESDCEKGAYHD